MALDNAAHSPVGGQHFPSYTTIKININRDKIGAKQWEASVKSQVISSAKWQPSQFLPASWDDPGTGCKARCHCAQHPPPRAGPLSADSARRWRGHAKSRWPHPLFRVLQVLEK